MRPVVILDANALYNQNVAFTNSSIQQLISLSSRQSIRLVIPEVVLHELSRQWAKSVRDARAKLHTALEAYNSLTAKANVAASSIDDELQDRATFFDEASGYLKSIGVELPAYPSSLSIEEVLTRDLDYRKPFDEKGKGFRDALIWETVRNLVADLGNDTPVILVTDNWSDFRSDADGPLHEDLQVDLAVDRVIAILSKPTEVVDHPAVKPLLEAIQAAVGALTMTEVVSLVEAGIDRLADTSLRDAIGEWESDGFVYLPIETPLSEPEISGYDVDLDSVVFSIFHTAGPAEMGLRVTVTADVELDGYLDRSEASLYYDDYSTVRVNGEWNRWTVTATDYRKLRIQFGASFSADEIDKIRLEVENVEDITDS